MLFLKINLNLYPMRILHRFVTCLLGAVGSGLSVRLRKTKNKKIKYRNNKTIFCFKETLVYFACTAK